MRSMWRGSISFGLVNIPVKMYSATESKSIRFNQLHSLCHTPIKYQKVCPQCAREVSPQEIVRGYEYEKGQYVIVTDEEWAQFEEKLSRAVDILRFVDLGEIDPVYFDKAYYLEPSETGGKAYTLLKEAMVQSGKIGVARMTIRSKSSLAVVRVYRRILALETIFYPDEIRDTAGLQTDVGASIQEKELNMAISLIESLSEPFKPEHYEDTRRTGLLELIQNKIAGQETVAAAPLEKTSNVIDLMSALEASLQAQQTKVRDYGEEVRH